MSKVIEIGISKSSGDKIENVTSVDAIKGKGLRGDRKFKTNNNIKSQLTLIEIENINYYNEISSSRIKPLDFRRNIVTEGVDLNNLVNKEFFIGKIKVKGHDLCRPCKYLENLLNQKNLVKPLILKAGLRCEILTTGQISVNDIIKTND